jgi:uncharacterized protein (TIGR02677 family)
MAERAARFYLLLGELARTTDHRAEVFLAHKDALLAHLRDFHDELQRYTPRLRDAVYAVEATGLDRLVEHAAEADERIFRSPAERLADWRGRWAGLRSWLAPPGADQASEADRLSEATMAAIGDVLSMLRRITEARRGGVSRESQLRHLAAWFAGVGSVPAAHTLFDVAFGLGTPRHVAVAFDDPEAIGTRQSWWDAPAVELSRTLVQSGRLPGQGNGRPARLDRQAGTATRLRREQLARERRLATAAAGLADTGLADTAERAGALDDDQTQVLLRLLDIALAARTAGGPRVPLVASAHGVRLTLSPAPGAFSTVTTNAGLLHVAGYTLRVAPAGHTVARQRVAVAG